MKTRFLWLTIFFVVVLFGFEKVNACSCRVSNPPCGGIEKSSIVFLAEVISVSIHNEERTAKNKEFIPFIGKKAQVKVLESFNNMTAKELVVETGLGGGDCGFNFKEGEKYLIYAHEYKGRILTSICSRTQLLTTAQEEVEILRELKTKKTVKSRIFGNVVLINREDDYSVNPLSKVKILLKNEKGSIFRTETDLMGNYKLVDLPLGKYTIEATYKTNFIKEINVEIKKTTGDQCAEPKFYFYDGGRIAGKVVDSNGNPVSGLRIIAMKIAISDGEESDWTSYDGYTNQNGNYEIEGLPNGKYYLGFNFFEPIKKEFPYPPMFYPGKETKQEAARFSVTDEFSLNNHDFFISQKIIPRLIKGKITLLNGKPAIGAMVDLKEERTTWRMDSADVDEQGNFSLSAFSGQSYNLYVYDSSTSWGINKEAKKVHIPKTGEIGEMNLVLPIWGKIEGIITDETGKVFEEASLYLQTSVGSNFSEQRIQPWNGAFSFPLYEGGKNKIYAKVNYGKYEGLKSEIIDISKNDIGKKLKLEIKTKK